MKKYNMNEIKCMIEFFDGLVVYGEKMIIFFGMCLDKVFIFFN